MKKSISKYHKSLVKTNYILNSTPSTKNALLHYFHLFMLVLIVLNVVSVILESVDSIERAYSFIFTPFEEFSVFIFTAEFIGRVWSCTASKKIARASFGRLKFLLRPMMVVDLLAILPFYLPMVTEFDFRFLWILRFSRIIRLLKIGRYSDTYRMMGRVFDSRKEPLILSAVMVFTILLLSSCLMYFLEKEAQPDIFPNIPAAIWWGTVTLTTVGYGDIFPVTVGGKIVGGLISFMGIGIFALPAGILASGFSDELNRQRCNTTIKCPHCGEIIHHKNMHE